MKTHLRAVFLSAPIFLVPVLVHATSGFTEEFDGSSLDSSWEQFYANADNDSFQHMFAQYSVSGGQLLVTDVVPMATGNYTADLILRRSVESLGDFEAGFDFEWDMQRDGSEDVVEHRKAVPRILIRLLDQDGGTIAEAGLEDRVYSGGTAPFGDFVADVDLSSKAAGFAYAYRAENSDFVGGATVQIVREAEEIQVFFGEASEPVVVKADGRLVEDVEMVFGRRHFSAFDDEFFGEASVNSVSIEGSAEEPPPPPPPPGFAERFELLRQTYDMNNFADNPLGNAVGWGAGNILMAYLAKFEATGDVRYLSKIQIHAEKIFANRSDRIGQIDEIRGKMMPAWTSTVYSPGEEHHAWLVHAGNFLFPVVRSAYLINQDPDLRQEFGHYADWAVEEAIEVMTAFEEEDWHDGPDPDEGHFRGLPQEQWEDDPLPYNMMHTAGRTYVALWLATGDEHFQEKAERLARFWRNRLDEVSDRFEWTYSTYYPDRIEDFSHGAISVDFAFHAYRAEIFFDEDDMDRLIETLRFLSRGEDGFISQVDGTGDLGQSDQAHRWMHLAYLDPDLIDLYEAWFVNNWDTAAPLQMVHAAAYMAEVDGGSFSFESPEPPSAPAPAPVPERASLVDRFDRERLFNDGRPAGTQWFSRGYPLEFIGAAYHVNEGEFVVTGVDTRASGNFTPDVRFTRPVRPVAGDFDATFDFRWDMTSPVSDTVVENRKAVPRALIRLLDAAGNTVAEAGLEDRIYSGSSGAYGDLVAGVNVPEKGPGYAYPYREENAEHIGGAVVRIERSGEDIEIYFDDNSVATGTSGEEITQVEMVFGRRHFDALNDEFFGRVAVNELSIQVPVMSFDDWREAHFSPEEMDDQKVSGADADADGLGIPNLLRYAFAMDARRPERELLPSPETVTSEGECYPAFEFTRIASDELEYELLISEDLADWRDASAETETVSVVPVGDGERVLIRGNVPCSDVPRQFFRVNVRLLY